MKKIFAMAAIALFMVSCSDDDSNNTNGQSTKVSKIIETDSEETLTSTAVYDGNKLIGINGDNGEKQVITYTGNLVTEWKTFDANNNLIQKDIYMYNSQNQLVTYYDLSYGDFEGGSKYVYTHNANGTISFTEYYGSDVDNLSDFTDKGSEGVITDTTLTTIYSGGEDDVNLITYTFDGKNNPSKNITGMDKIAFAGTMGSKKFNTENVTSQSYSHNGNTSVLEVTTAYTYNAANFPLTETHTVLNSPESTITLQYIYE